MYGCTSGRNQKASEKIGRGFQSQRYQNDEPTLRNGSASPAFAARKCALWKQFHGQEGAERAEKYFETVFQKSQVPENVPTIIVDPSLIPI